MTTGGITVKGAARFSETMNRAAADMADMRTADTKAARIVAGAGARAAPRLTGRLAASLTPSVGRQTATITSPLVYAVPVHWGRPAHNIEANPFVWRAAQATQSEWMGGYETDAQHACDMVKGA